MVYKKYIEKDGKLYGPYVYHSRRVDGKVVSEYHGSSYKKLKKYSLVVFGALILLAIFYTGFKLSNSSTGLAIFNAQATYHENQSLDSFVNFSMKDGEFLPANSTIVVQMPSGINYSYTLKDVVSNDLKEGDFYIEDKRLSGHGEGYGNEGEGKIYPPVDFTVEVYSDVTAEDNQNETLENPSQDSNESDQVPADESSDVTPEVSPDEVPSDNSKEDQVDESSQDESSDSGVAITGQVVNGQEGKGILSRFFNFFKASISGNAVNDQISIREVEGDTSEGVWTYELNDGENARVKSGSVSYNRSRIDEDYLSLDVNSGNVIVNSSYYIDDHGYGKNFLSDDYTQEIIINLTKLELPSEAGQMKIGIVYNGYDLFSNTLNLSNGVTVSTNITVNETISNLTINSSDNEITLTDEELNLLHDEFGDFSLNITKATLLNGRIILRYELGKYWVEFSYEGNSSTDLNPTDLSRDRIKWLKDLAFLLKEEKNTKQNQEVSLDDLVGSVSVESNSSEVEQ